MLVFIDGKRVKVDNDVKVVYDSTPDCSQQLHITLTYEGIVHDVIQNGEVLNTSSETYDEAMERLREDDDQG